MPNEEEKKIAKELIEELKAESLKNESLYRLSVDEPSELTPDYRIKELEKIARGEESEWGRTEVEAEKLYREEEEK